MPDSLSTRSAYHRVLDAVHDLLGQDTEPAVLYASSGFCDRLRNDESVQHTDGDDADEDAVIGVTQAFDVVEAEWVSPDTAVLVDPSHINGVRID